MSAAAKIWFITGASSGFGRAMTEYLLDKGDTVVATLRNPPALDDLSSKYPARKFLVLKVNITSEDDIAAAFEKARSAFGRIDVVFNNAGAALIAELEGTSEKAARHSFEVNFWGAVNVSKRAVAFFRDVNQPSGGRLLQMSSGAGIVGQPGLGIYSAAKFALEGFSESLSKELDPKWNIKVTIIEPGTFRTYATTQNLTTEPVHPKYTDASLQSARMRAYYAAGHTIIDGDPNKAAAVMERLVHLEDPPMRLAVHKMVISFLRDKAQSMLADAENFESWSEDVYVDDADDSCV